MILINTTQRQNATNTLFFFFSSLTAKVAHIYVNCELMGLLILKNLLEYDHHE